MPPDTADTVYRYLGIITHLADGTVLSDTEVLRGLIDNYQIEPLDLEEGCIPQWDIVSPTDLTTGTKYKEIVQNPTGNPTTELVPFTDSELTELLFRE